MRTNITTNMEFNAVLTRTSSSLFFGRFFQFLMTYFLFIKIYFMASKFSSSIEKYQVILRIMISEANTQKHMDKKL